VKSPESPGSACPFCSIARGGSDAAVVYEDEASIAFLDNRPLFPGHCLLIPRVHYETLPELPAGLAAQMFRNAQLLCVAVEKGTEAEGSFVAINNKVSQSVSHLHVHIVPRKRKDGLRGFFWPRTHYRDEMHKESVRLAIKSAVPSL
jgi:histidine triad (HIT) family protein